MEALSWRRRWGSSPAARRGARQRAGLTHAAASNTLSCERETLHPKQLRPEKIRMTVITVSTATHRGPAEWPQEQPQEHASAAAVGRQADQTGAVSRDCGVCRQAFAHRMAGAHGGRARRAGVDGRAWAYFFAL